MSAVVSATSAPIAHPFFKTAGGKRALLSELRRLMPAKFRVYHEPFVGGGALFFDLENDGRLGLGAASLSDTNEELINAYKTIDSNIDALVSLLKKPYCYRYEEECFYAVRALDPLLLSTVERAARIIFLNRTCFNGLHRVNQKGQFNVPFGRYTNPTICDEENLRACSAALTGVTLRSCDFEEALSHTYKGDFAYLDPPYVPISKTSNFTAYGKDGFGEAHQRRLAAAFRKHAERGVLLMLSNSDAPLVWELYKGFGITEVQASRNVNSKAAKRGKVTELVVRSWVKS